MRSCFINPKILHEPTPSPTPPRLVQDDNIKQVAITCLPVAESLSGDITGYIQTNLMSMTDGHLYFDSDLFFRGSRPAVNIFLSVTRVGRQTQSALFRDLGQKIMIKLKKFDEAQRFLRFGSELMPEIQDTLRTGESLNNLFNQGGEEPVPANLSAVLLSLAWSGFYEGNKNDVVISNYNQTRIFQKTVGEIVSTSQNLAELNQKVLDHKSELLKWVR